jgi:hypothetical protein
MTTETYVARVVLPGAFSLLPGSMATPEASALLIAIGRQESDEWRARRQYANGPARSFWQFERGGGVVGVLRHEATKEHARRICRLLCVEPTPEAVHTAIEYQDVLAAVFARLLLYSDERPLPSAEKPVDGWLLYLATWRPGKPIETKWAGNFKAGWALPWPGTVRA